MKTTLLHPVRIVDVIVVDTAQLKRDMDAITGISMPGNTALNRVGFLLQLILEGLEAGPSVRIQPQFGGVFEPEAEASDDGR